MLKIENLKCSLSNKTIIDNISLDLNSGVLYCVIGRNGSGKSTLFKTIDCLVPSDGNIIYDDIDIKQLNIKNRAKYISYLPQTRPLPNISVRLMVEHGRFPHLGFSKTLSENDYKIVEESIKKVGLENLKYKNLCNISGGELQKVYIASTLAQESKVLLLDEPTTHLDLESQIDILNIIKEINDKDKTIIVILHDLLQAFSFFDYIFIVDDGKIIDSGKPEELYKNENIKKIFNVHLEKEDKENALYKYKIMNY